MALTVEEWPIGRLIPYAKNPRKNEHAVERMMAAITEFGFRIPIVARSDGSVVDGHLRLKAGQRLGLATVPVALADDLSAAQIKAFRLLANRSATWADWDNEFLRHELSALRIDGFDLALTGFDLPEIASLFATPDEGAPDGERMAGGQLAARFGIAPFTVLNAREGWWQDRKRAWIALGIQSELGRGGEGADMTGSGAVMPVSGGDVKAQMVARLGGAAAVPDAAPAVQAA